ncbi:hypothetical protein GCM10011504_36100 [Siccirubricoccus deserti]|uniref:DUF2491 family protein n=1 Tax=Siccirubricoccus deserti TaxID=2013562 RepID=A0A9X0UE07_9PROT|nr:DUF2491 family protein [Siccirubricoccus deserti]MBC4017214.1 DUF2491 family protein [Siccirubricoccus deserti]GGC54500.1 hypothetical protein GCM10011504_36100 [Siccirubricoccus deserti]
MPRRLRACLFSLLLLHAGAAWPLGAMLAAGTATEALAQARSSGGYSRPRAGYGRTPSFGGPRVAPRTPSTSGGYGRPGSPAPSYSRRPSVNPSVPRGSAWDRSYSQERSAEALNRMRRQQEQARQPPLSPNPDPGWWRRGGTAPVGRNGGWYGDRGWSPGGLPGLGNRSFGLWSGVFLGYLLSNLGRAGAVDFFHNHQDDPGYRQWRAEAERQAQENAELRQRLDELDRRLAERQDQPRDPNYLPPGVPAEVALAPRADARTPSLEDSGPSPLLWLLILGGGGAFVLLALRRRRAASSAQPAAPGRRMPDIGARSDFSAAPRFRVGMTLTCDPTPFLLAGNALKVPPPAFAEADPRVSVQAVGRIREGADELTRLYLPDGRGLFQIHLDAEGQFGECRYFATIDEVTPADTAEWGAWLDPQQGMIGWPEFQTKDGKLYTRLWAPGPNPVPPRSMVETIEGLAGTQEVRIQAMLYAAPTGAAAPAPETEYILASALEAGARAWVEIRAGIDINPASLSLA